MPKSKLKHTNHLHDPRVFLGLFISLFHIKVFIRMNLFNTPEKVQVVYRQKNANKTQPQFEIPASPSSRVP